MKISEAALIGCKIRPVQSARYYTGLDPKGETNSFCSCFWGSVAEGMAGKKLKCDEACEIHQMYFVEDDKFKSHYGEYSVTLNDTGKKTREEIAAMFAAIGE